MVCGVRQNFYVFSLYRKPDLDDLIFYCLLTSMAAGSAEDVRGDLNGHHHEWLDSKITNRHSVAAFDFATVSGSISWLSAPSMHVVEHLTF